MTVKTRILEAAAELLSQSPSGDISTRAVCETAGVGAPTLYRHFADKDTLLAAVVDFGFEQYLDSKRAAVPSGDPVQDVRDGWDRHVAFAVEHPNHYKLMYSPVLTSRPESAVEAHRMLTEVVERIAAAGRLRVPVPLAAQMIMSANTGVALSLLYRPDINTDPHFSTAVREAVVGAVTSEAPATVEARADGAGRPGGTDRTGDIDRTPAPEGMPAALPITATTLGAQLRVAPPADILTPVETAMLQEWLSRLEQRSAERTDQS